MSHKVLHDCKPYCRTISETPFNSDIWQNILGCLEHTRRLFKRYILHSPYIFRSFWLRARGSSLKCGHNGTALFNERRPLQRQMTGLRLGHLGSDAFRHPAKLSPDVFADRSIDLFMTDSEEKQKSVSHTSPMDLSVKCRSIDQRFMNRMRTTAKRKACAHPPGNGAKGLTHEVARQAVPEAVRQRPTGPPLPDVTNGPAPPQSGPS